MTDTQQKRKGYIIEIPDENAYLGRLQNVFVTKDKSQATPYGSLSAAKVALKYALKRDPEKEYAITEL